MINLYLQYFKHSKENRRKELDFCTKKNINNKHIDKIYILLEKEEDKQDWMIKDNVEVINHGKRMSFKNFVEFSNNIDNDDIHVIANLDMFFDDTILKLKENNIDNTFVALTRWNIDSKTKKAELWMVNCSQDTWAWKGKVDLTKVDLDYPMGKAGCDNAICGEFHEAGYKVINPSMDLRTFHLHDEIIRDYDKNDVVKKKLYLLIPTKDWNQSLIQYWKDCSNL